MKRHVPSAFVLVQTGSVAGAQQAPLESILTSVQSGNKTQGCRCARACNQRRNTRCGGMCRRHYRRNNKVFLPANSIVRQNPCGRVYTNPMHIRRPHMYRLCYRRHNTVFGRQRSRCRPDQSGSVYMNRTRTRYFRMFHRTDKCCNKPFLLPDNIRRAFRFRFGYIRMMYMPLRYRCHRRYIGCKKPSAILYRMSGIDC